MLFALLVVLAGVPGAELLFSVTGAVVVVSVVAHGASATPLANRYARRVDRETLDEERESTATGLFVSAPEDVERISIEELHALMEGTGPPVVVDVRSRSQYERDEGQIPGSVRMLPDEIAAWTPPPDRLIVPYCT
jgi:NhaP-type Na+/H+ or K+/H+ antiporter